jgi:hypothetical protein
MQALLRPRFTWIWWKQLPLRATHASVWKQPAQRALV